MTGMVGLSKYIPCFSLMNFEGNLVGVVIRNFCKDPGLIKFVNDVIRLSIEVKRNVRVGVFAFASPTRLRHLPPER